MRHGPAARRVVLVVLDGLRPDAIERFDLANLRRLMASGASSLVATTVSPSVTTAAMTSLMTGVSPAVHGLSGDRLFIPKTKPGIVPLPEHLASQGFPSTAFMTDVPVLFRGITARIGRRLGLSSLRLAGDAAAATLAAAGSTLRTQRRGLILFHWPDADRAGHAHGWMSPAYGDGCRRLDASLGALAAMAGDSSTLLVALADHGGGGVVAKDHEGDHWLDRTIPLLLHGDSIAPGALGPATLLDAPTTMLHALGVESPPSYEGRVLYEAFVAHETLATAVA